MDLQAIAGKIDNYYCEIHGPHGVSENFNAAKIKDMLQPLADRIAELEAAIRKHHDQQGDDRCWLDDLELYDVIPDLRKPDDNVFKLPPKCEFLKSCERFWEQSQHPKLSMKADGMTIAQLEARVKELEAFSAELTDKYARQSAALTQAAERQYDRENAAYKAGQERMKQSLIEQAKTPYNMGLTEIQDLPRKDGE